MSIQITAVRYGGYQKAHEAITELRWVGRETRESGDITKPALVTWLDANTANRAFVSTGWRTVEVGTVQPQYGQPYVRTYADGAWSDNLLALPTF